MKVHCNNVICASNEAIMRVTVYCAIVKCALSEAILHVI